MYSPATMSTEFDSATIDTIDTASKLTLYRPPPKKKVVRKAVIFAKIREDALSRGVKIKDLIQMEMFHEEKPHHSPSHDNTNTNLHTSTKTTINVDEERAYEDEKFEPDGDSIEELEGASPTSKALSDLGNTFNSTLDEYLDSLNIRYDHTPIKKPHSAQGYRSRIRQQSPQFRTRPSSPETADRNGNLNSSLEMRRPWR